MIVYKIDIMQLSHTPPMFQQTIFSRQHASVSFLSLPPTLLPLSAELISFYSEFHFQLSLFAWRAKAHIPFLVSFPRLLEYKHTSVRKKGLSLTLIQK